MERELRDVRREIAKSMGKVKSLTKTLEEQSKGLSECFDEQNTFVRNHLVEFLQTLDECPRGENSPIPCTWGEEAWKLVITCWVHLELMCIFPAM